VRLRPVYFVGYWLTRILSWLLFRPRIIGRENVPRDGGFIMASNHISYFDPPLVGSWQGRRMYFFTKQELFQNRLFGAVLRACNSLPVRRGTIDRQAIRLATEIIHQGYGLVFFPEGTRSRTDQFLPAKPGLGVVARTAECPIVPVYLHGSNRLKDCFRRRARMTIVYGEPFPTNWVKSFAPMKSGYQAMAEAVMERITHLRKQVTSVK
jgi:1-acyl-sn-glycerol-3-phosphate acyltransferase